MHLTSYPKTIIFFTFCSVFLSRQHIHQQNTMTANNSQQPISEPCLRDCAQFKMKAQVQSAFELQIQVKWDFFLQTMWLVGLLSRCILTGRHTLTFYFNVHSVQIWAESERQTKEPSCSILRGNLLLCLEVCAHKTVRRLLIAFKTIRKKSSNHHNLSMDVNCCFRDSAGRVFRHVLHTGETCISVLLLLLPQAHFVSAAKPSISSGGEKFTF